MPPVAVTEAVPTFEEAKQEPVVAVASGQGDETAPGAT
jgi:hypothetical protein